jgi:hypothetical protein
MPLASMPWSWNTDLAISRPIMVMLIVGGSLCRSRQPAPWHTDAVGGRPPHLVQDEARFGQKGRVCHRWFTRGQRPPGLCDQRYTWTHLFAAARPATGEAFALVLPQVSTAAMNAFLARFAATLAEDEHAAWCSTVPAGTRAKKLVVPSNVTLVWLPPYSPQLNPVERIWLFLRERHLSHRLLDTYDAVADALCQAWNALTAERIHSLTSYPIWTGQF